MLIHDVLFSDKIKKCVIGVAIDIEVEWNDARLGEQADGVCAFNAVNVTKN